MNSIADKQLKEPNMIESRENAGVNHASLKITSLVE
jgi:hypothetical protein